MIAIAERENEAELIAVLLNGGLHFNNEITLEPMKSHPPSRI